MNKKINCLIIYLSEFNIKGKLKLYYEKYYKKDFMFSIYAYNYKLYRGYEKTAKKCHKQRN